MTVNSLVSRLDELFNRDYREDQPGAGVVVFDNDRVTYQRCIGLANLEQHERITPDTNFRLASLTKQFTAYGIALLEQQGRLSTSDTLDRFLPTAFRTRCPRVSAIITIEHLLHHSSGIMDYENSPLGNHDQWSDADVLNAVEDRTYFTSGTQYRYSNTGYILLGAIIEIASAQPLADFFHRHIFEPFGMKNSVLYGSEHILIPNRALGYVKGENTDRYTLCDQSPTSATRGDGGIYMSLNDYLQWYRHCHPLASSSIVPITEKSSSDYGYSSGWFLSDSTGHMRSHIGDSCGFTHQVFRIDQEDTHLLVLYLSNIGNNHERLSAFNQLIVETLPSALSPKDVQLLQDMPKLTR